jgi:hypothetical protein
MTQKPIDRVHGQTGARGNAIATFCAGVSLTVAPLFAPFANGHVPEHLSGFAVFLAGIALMAWAIAELDFLAAAERTGKRNPGGRDAA